MESKVDVKKVGETIAKLRKKNGLTQLQLAEKLYVSDKAISRWETGEGLPEIVNLMELAKIFNVSLESLLKGEYIEDSVNESNAQTNEETKKENTAQPGQKTNPETKVVYAETKPKKAEDKHFVSNIISAVLGGLSILSNLVFPVFIGLVIAVVGLILSKNPIKTPLHKAAKALNIAGIIISVIAMVIVLVVVIIFGTQIFSIFGDFQSIFNNF